jgi:hypothetical protein
MSIREIESAKLWRIQLDLCEGLFASKTSRCPVYSLDGAAECGRFLDAPFGTDGAACHRTGSSPLQANPSAGGQELPFRHANFLPGTGLTVDPKTSIRLLLCVPSCAPCPIFRVREVLHSRTPQ